MLVAASMLVGARCWCVGIAPHGQGRGGTALAVTNIIVGIRC